MPRVSKRRIDASQFAKLAPLLHARGFEAKSIAAAERCLVHGATLQTVADETPGWGSRQAANDVIQRIWSIYETAVEAQEKVRAVSKPLPEDWVRLPVPGRLTLSVNALVAHELFSLDSVLKEPAPRSVANKAAGKKPSSRKVVAAVAPAVKAKAKSSAAPKAGAQRVAKPKPKK